MMLSDIVERVITETGRPDLADLIQLTAQSSVRQVHAKAKFRRDLIEETIVVPSPNTLIRLTLPPHFRMFRDVFIVDNYGVPKAECLCMQPSSIMSQNTIKNVQPSYYVAGTTYTVMANNLFIPIQYLYVSYYGVPPLENLGSSTWMTELYPEAIVNYTLYKVHAKTGNSEKARECLALYESQFRDVVEDQEVD